MVNTNMESLAEQFYKKGYRGKALTKAVLQVGLIGAIAFKNDEAKEHFEKRIEELGEVDETRVPPVDNSVFGFEELTESDKEMNCRKEIVNRGWH